MMIVLVIATLGGSRSALAVPLQGQQPSSNQKTGQLVVDCAATLKTSRGREYAERTGICGSGIGIVPQGTVVGDCGTSTVTIVNTPGGGTVSIYQSAISSRGNILLLTEGSFSHTAAPNSVLWNTSDLATTGTPTTVIATMTYLYVVTSSGAICTGVGASDELKV
jgi:hypothetical protein